MNWISKITKAALELLALLILGLLASLIFGLYLLFSMPFYWIARRNDDKKLISDFLNETKITKEDYINCKISYSETKIPKKTSGLRTIRIPNKTLKNVQSNLAFYLTKKISKQIHRNCHSYRKFRSTLTNATPHIGQVVLIKLDIKNYFDVISRNSVENIIKNIQLPDKFKSRLVDIVMNPNHIGIPQGAPTSPVISNLVLKEFDKKITSMCHYNKCKYTRYADDMTFSLPVDDSKLIAFIIKFVENELNNNGFKLNKKKGKIHVLRPHQAQRICGITINSGKPTISRKQKRILRAARHRIENGKEATFTPQQLSGWDSYIKSVEMGN